MSTEGTLSDPEIRLDRRRPVVNQIFDILRADIIALRLAPGAALSRNALAARFAVSQTPIRDALLRLEEQGLVEIRPQSSTRVSLIDARQARQSHFLRLAVELEVARTIARAPARYRLDQPQAILRDMRGVWQRTGDPAAIRPPDQAFHAALCTAVGHHEVWELIVARSGNVDRLRSIYVYPGKIEKILSEHEALLGALAAGDEAGAEQTVRTHLGGTLGAIEEMRAARPQYFAPADGG